MSEPAAPPVTTDKVTVKDHDKFGRSAFAAQDIAAGEVVICEDPLLSVSLSEEDKVLRGLLKQVEQYVSNHRDELGEDAQLIHPSDWQTGVAFYLQFCRASSSVQQQVLSDMFSKPDGPGMEETAPVVRASIQAKVLAALAPIISKILKMEATVAAAKGLSSGPESTEASDDAEVIKQVLFATELNVHAFRNEAAAMYSQGSKLAHTCDSPNTCYKSFKNRGCHVAMRDIKEGELLTTTYLPAELHIASGFARRQYLESHFSFTCRCPLCSQQIDKLCNIPCPRCPRAELQRTAAGYLPEAALEGPPDLGLLFYDPQKAASACCSTDPPADGSAAKPWQCNKCGAEFEDRDDVLVGEYDFIKSASARLRNWSYGNFLQHDPQKGQQRLEQVAIVMGGAHWAVHAMMAKQTDLLCMIVRHLGGVLQDKQKPPSRDQLEMLSHAVQGVGQNLLTTWSWATEKIGMSAEEAADRLVQPLTIGAAALFYTSAYMLDVPKLRNSQQSLIAKMQLLAADFSDKAEPALAKYRRWQTPEPHPLIRQLLMARTLAEVKAQAAAAAAAAGEQGQGKGGSLSVQELADFLPGGGTKAVAAAGKKGTKKKANSKK